MKGHRTSIWKMATNYKLHRSPGGLWLEPKIVWVRMSQVSWTGNDKHSLNSFDYQALPELVFPILDWSPTGRNLCLFCNHRARIAEHWHNHVERHLQFKHNRIWLRHKKCMVQFWNMSKPFETGFLEHLSSSITFCFGCISHAVEERQRPQPCTPRFGRFAESPGKCRRRERSLKHLHVFLHVYCMCHVSRSFNHFQSSLKKCKFQSYAQLIKHDKL